MFEPQREERASIGIVALDVEAAYQYLTGPSAIAPGRVGLFGNSMGSVVAILYAAAHPGTGDDPWSATRRRPADISLRTGPDGSRLHLVVIA